MVNDVVKINVMGVVPMDRCGALFLGDPTSKIFMMTVDNTAVHIIQLYLDGKKSERPVVHDLMVMMFESLGVTLDRIVINDYKEETFYARMILRVQNELGQHKIIELDARPSDSVALAVRLDAPIYVSRGVWDKAEDESEGWRAFFEPPSAKD